MKCDVNFTYQEKSIKRNKDTMKEIVEAPEYGQRPSNFLRFSRSRPIHGQHFDLLQGRSREKQRNSKLGNSLVVVPNPDQ